MIETISPAVCGSRRRAAGALIAFALGAVAAAVGLGLALALVGAQVGGRRLLPLVAVAALVGSLREAGVLRLAVPQRRWQVPVRWHRELPLARWALGYGLGLGVGVLTYLPVSTLLVVILATLCLASLPLGAVAFAAFGIGRALAAAAPATSVPRLAGLLRPMRLANAVVLAALALVPATAQAAPSAVAAGSRYDPAALDDGTFAYVDRSGDGTTAVVVRRPDGTSLRIAGAESPALDADLVAYADATGLAVVRWHDGSEVARLPGRWRKPALAWPYLVGIRDEGAVSILVAVDLERRSERVLARRSARRFDLGRPSLAGRTVVWSESANQGSWIRRVSLVSHRRTTLLHTVRRLLVNPSLHDGRLVWVEQVRGVSRLREAWLRPHPRGRVRFAVRGAWLLWTTALTRHAIYVTLWNVSTRRALIIRIRA